MPKSGSFLAVDKQNIIISAVKKSETGNDIIIRCVETSGVSCSASVDIRFAAAEWKGDFSPFEIKTLRIDGNNNSVNVVNLLEE